jgi:hypothetical protein
VRRSKFFCTEEIWQVKSSFGSVDTANILMRRADLIQAPLGTLTGWAFSTSDPIEEVEIVSAQNNNGSLTRAQFAATKDQPRLSGHESD